MRRIIHREGRRIILNSTLIILLLAVTACWLLPPGISIPILLLLTLCLLFVCRFFRVPRRIIPPSKPGAIYSPADGTIVAIEEVFVDEYLNEKRIQLSIFMSVWNVHINWYPASGEVEYFRHHPGRFLVAWNPKSSTDNERTTTVVRLAETDGEGNPFRLLYRQIAGYVARRIVYYSSENTRVTQGNQCGFIKFGSRVDLFLPIGSEVHVKLDQQVTGVETLLATLPGYETEN